MEKEAKRSESSNQTRKWLRGTTRGDRTLYPKRAIKTRCLAKSRNRVRPPVQQSTSTCRNRRRGSTKSSESLFSCSYILLSRTQKHLVTKTLSKISKATSVIQLSTNLMEMAIQDKNIKAPKPPHGVTSTSKPYNDWPNDAGVGQVFVYSFDPLLD